MNVKPWHVALFAVVLALLSGALHAMLGSAPPPAPGSLNNKISVDACLSHGGIPIFDSFAVRYHEEPMMTSCYEAIR